VGGENAVDLTFKLPTRNTKGVWKMIIQLRKVLKRELKMAEI
jgi:hypothetical protein